MKAMILAAGKGSRLAPLTQTTPKPMLPLAGKPLIEWQIEALSRAGFSKIFINLHHLGEQIEAPLGHGEKWQVEIQYSAEPQLLETGGGIVNALDLLGDAPFVVLNGDIWTDFDFKTLHNALHPPNMAHVVLTPTPAYRETGDFEYAQGQVTRRGNRYVYCGIAVLSPNLFAGLEVGEFSLRDLYFGLVTDKRLSAQVHEGVWHDIGTLEQYEALAASLDKI